MIKTFKSFFKKKEEKKPYYLHTSGNLPVYVLEPPEILLDKEKDKPKKRGNKK